jgi:hypothetical protein
MRIVNQTLGLRQLPWVKSGTGMWDHFIDLLGLGTPKELESIKKHRQNAKILASVPAEKRHWLYKFKPRQGLWDEPQI